MRAARGAIAVAIALAASCRAHPAPTRTPTVATAKPTAAPSASSSAPPPTLAEEGPLWARASGGDPLELSRLAVDEGAAGLLDGVEAGGEPRRVALLALPYADDAETALGRLGELARTADAAQLGPILDAMLGIAHRPATQRERLDPEGVRAAEEALAAVAARNDIGEEERGIARSAARALAAGAATR